MANFEIPPSENVLLSLNKPNNPIKFLDEKNV
jgi:hypothetical protein